MTGISANNVHGQDIEHAGTCRNKPEKWREMPEHAGKREISCKTLKHRNMPEHRGKTKEKNLKFDEKI